MNSHYRNGPQQKPSGSNFKTPMTFIQRDKDKAKPSPSRIELWREQLGLEDDPSQDQEEEISDSEDEPEADQDPNKIPTMEFQMIKKKLDQRTNERDELRLAMRMMTDKCKQYKEKLKREEDYKKQHMKIMRKTHEAHLMEKQNLISSQEDIISEQERKVTELEARLTELGQNLENSDSPEQWESHSGHSQLIEQLRRLQDEKADLTGHLLTAQAREEEVRRELMKERLQFTEDLHKLEIDNTDLQEEVVKLRNFQGIANNTDTEKQLKKLEAEKLSMKQEVDKLRNVAPRIVKETVTIKVVDETRITALEEIVKKLKRKCTSLESQVASANKELSESDNMYRMELQKANQESMDLAKEIGNLKAELLDVKSREPEVVTKFEKVEIAVESDAQIAALAAAKEQIAELTSQTESLHQSCQQCSLELAKSRQQHRSMEKEIQTAQNVTKSIEEDYQKKMEELELRKTQELETIKQNLHAQLAKANATNAGLQQEVRDLWPKVVELSRAHQGLREMCQSLPGIMASMVADVSKRITYSIISVSEHNKDLTRKYREEILLRKKYHNELVELKGNIRVFTRVRPWIAEDGGGVQSSNVVEFDEVDDSLVSIKNRGGRVQTFEFDAVFREKSTQIEVFDEVSPLVVSCIDGYNVCIFAYGQTGSGKTFTMEGPNNDPGINQRALIELFREIKDRGKDWSFTVTVSVMEIYNEMLRDLLSSDPTQKLEIKMLPEGGLHVPTLTKVEVKNVEDINQTFELGHLNRATASTNMNQHSSRSHALLSVTVVGFNKTLKTKSIGKLNLVDLAGSERVAKSGADGARLREAQNINKSLAALGNVIQALKTKQPHTPYRDSKLTYLLQDSLGGDSKTLMIMQVSPVEKNVSETICTLDFGQRCRRVELGKASKRIEHADNSETKTPTKPTTPRKR